MMEINSLRFKILKLGFFFLITAFCFLSLDGAGEARGQEWKKRHALSAYDNPKYPANFKNFDYVYPKAPKQGVLHLNSLTSFYSFNPFNVKSSGAAESSEMLFDSLMVRSADEPYSVYGLIAESVQLSDDKSEMIFNLRSKARFHNNQPVRADDVLFSFEILKEKGNPKFRSAFAKVKDVQVMDDLRIKFTLNEKNNRLLPLILSQMPILSRADWTGHDFAEATTSRIPMGSGPYRVGRFEPGRFVEFTLDPDYWAKDLPVNRGSYNFKAIRYEYFKDLAVAFNSFKSGGADLMVETVAKNWAQGYDFPAVTEGKVIKKTFPYGGVYGMQGFVFNLRRPIFQDRRIRQALGYAFDFDWMSFAYFFGQYQRSLSFFNNSELEAKGLPSVVERDLLDPLRPEISSEIFNEITSKEFTLPQTGRDEWKLRENLLEAKRLLEEAGCYFKDKKLMLPGSNEPFRFTLLIDDFAWARIASSWARNLRRLGIEMEYQVLDTSIFENRLRSFDFDTILYIWGGNMLPGDELRNQWGSAAADIPGSENISGLKSLAVDQLIEQITAAKTYSDLVTRVRVLDRLLNSSYLVVPHWYMKFTRVAFWDKFGFPEKTPLKGVQFDTWWIKDEYAEISENQKN